MLMLNRSIIGRHTSVCRTLTNVRFRCNMDKNVSKKILGKLIANIETDEYNINQHINQCLQKIEDTWSDVSVDYSSVEEYFLELVDVDSWVSKNWITFSVEFKESE